MTWPWPFGRRPRRGPPAVKKTATISGNPDQIARLMQAGALRLVTPKK